MHMWNMEGTPSRQQLRGDAHLKEPKSSGRRIRSALEMLAEQPTPGRPLQQQQQQHQTPSPQPFGRSRESSSPPKTAKQDVVQQQQHAARNGAFTLTSTRNNNKVMLGSAANAADEGGDTDEAKPLGHFDTHLQRKDSPENFSRAVEHVTEPSALMFMSPQPQRRSRSSGGTSGSQKRRSDSSNHHHHQHQHQHQASQQHPDESSPDFQREHHREGRPSPAATSAKPSHRHREGDEGDDVTHLIMEREARRDAEEEEFLLRLSQEIEDLNRRNGQLVELNTQLEQDKAKVVAHHEVLTSTVTQINEELVAEREKCRKLDIELCHANDAVKVLRQEHEKELSFEKAQAQQAVAFEREELEAAFRVKLDAAQKKLFETEEIVSHRDETIARLQAESANTAKENDLLKIALKESDDALVKLQEELQAATAKAEQLHRKAQMTDKKAASLEALRQEDATVFKERIALLESGSKLQADDIRKKLHRLQQLENDREQREAVLRQVEAEKEKLQGKVDQLTTAIEVAAERVASTTSSVLSVAKGNQREPAGASSDSDGVADESCSSNNDGSVDRSKNDIDQSFDKDAITPPKQHLGLRKRRVLGGGEEEGDDAVVSPLTEDKHASCWGGGRQHATSRSGAKAAVPTRRQPQSSVSHHPRAASKKGAAAAKPSSRATSRSSTPDLAAKRMCAGTAGMNPVQLTKVIAAQAKRIAQSLHTAQDVAHSDKKVIRRLQRTGDEQAKNLEAMRCELRKENERVDQCERALAEMGAALQAARADATALLEQIAAGEAKQQDEGAAMQRLNKQFVRVTFDLDEARAEISAKEQKLVQLSAELTESNNRYDQAREEAIGAHRRLEKATADAVAFEREAEALRRDLQRTKDAHAEALEGKEKARSKHRAAQEELARATSKIADLTKELSAAESKNKTLEQRASTVRRDIERQQQKLVAQAAAAAAAVPEKSPTQAVSEPSPALSGAVKRLTQENESLIKENAAMKVKVKHLTAEVDAAVRKSGVSQKCDNAVAAQLVQLFEDEAAWLRQLCAICVEDPEDRQALQSRERLPLRNTAEAAVKQVTKERSTLASKVIDLERAVHRQAEAITFLECEANVMRTQPDSAIAAPSRRSEEGRATTPRRLEGTVADSGSSSRVRRGARKMGGNKGYNSGPTSAAPTSQMSPRAGPEAMAAVAAGSQSPSPRPTVPVSAIGAWSEAKTARHHHERVSGPMTTTTIFVGTPSPAKQPSRNNDGRSAVASRKEHIMSASAWNGGAGLGATTQPQSSGGGALRTQAAATAAAFSSLSRSPEASYVDPGARVSVASRSRSHGLSLSPANSAKACSVGVRRPPAMDSPPSLPQLQPA